MTPTQSTIAKAIINIFETGSIRGDYAAVTVLSGDSGHLSYGRSQVTLGSGTLAELLSLYSNQPGARYRAAFAPFLPRAASRDFALDGDGYFKNLLRSAADDPVMRDSQDEFFDSEYWTSALRLSKLIGLESPLGVCVVYDSRVHGSWNTIKRRTIDIVGLPVATSEQAWIREYVRQRKHWLATHPRTILRLTVYRMEAFEDLMAQEGWTFDLPLVVREQEINLATLYALPQGVYDGPVARSRIVSLQSPLLRGADVRQVQLALSERSVAVKADGIYGRQSSLAVAQLQQREGLSVTGCVDKPDFDFLGL